MKLYWEIASRYLKSKRKESFISFISWFSIVGITLGVAVLIIVMSVMNGFRKEIVSSLIGINGHMFVNTSYSSINNYEEFLGDIKKIDPSITNVSPVISSQVLASRTDANASTGALVSALTYEDLVSREILIKGLNTEEISNFKTQNNVALVGRVVAQGLGLKVGSSVNIISPNGYFTAVGSIPKMASLKVVGIINTGMYQYDSSTIVVPFSFGQTFFNYEESSAQKLEIFIENAQQAKLIKEKILEYYGYSLVNIETWEESNNYIINALKVERNVMFLILSLVILIAAFNIVSGLIMLSRSKTREIAILKTMGMDSKSIKYIFLLVGLRVGGIGTITGTVVGILFSIYIDEIKKGIEFLLKGELFAEEVYFLSQLPTDINIYQIVSVFVLSLFFTIVSSIYPAIKASKINPAEGLKYE